MLLLGKTARRPEDAAHLQLLMARTTTSPALSPSGMHGQAMRAPYLVTVVAQRSLHRQRRRAGSHRMILIRQGAQERDIPPP